jgi:futalosine hydrolase
MILLTTATLLEQRLLRQAAGVRSDAPLAEGVLAGVAVRFLVTGIGMVNTAWALGWHLGQGQGAYSLLLNVGIAGAYDPATHPLLSVWELHQDCLGDLGAEDGTGWLGLEAMGFPSLRLPDGTAYFNRLPNPQPRTQLPAASGVTINTVTGSDAAPEPLRSRWQADLETMEGAAFFAAGLQAGVPFAAIRAVSNTVTRRNPAAWHIQPAAQAAQQALLDAWPDLLPGLLPDLL